jgi:hypothetical protein
MISLVPELGPIEAASREKCPEGGTIEIQHLGTAESPETVKDLKEWIGAMKDSSVAEEVWDAFRGEVCRSDKALFKELKRMSKAGMPGLRSETVWVLSFYGGVDARALVRRALRDDEEVVRLKALQGVYLACDPKALSKVQRLAEEDPSERVRGYAKMIASEMGSAASCAPMPGLGPEFG